VRERTDQERFDEEDDAWERFDEEDDAWEQLSAMHEDAVVHWKLEADLAAAVTRAEKAEAALALRAQDEQKGTDHGAGEWWNDAIHWIEGSGNVDGLEDDQRKKLTELVCELRMHAITEKWSARGLREDLSAAITRAEKAEAAAKRYDEGLTRVLVAMGKAAGVTLPDGVIPAGPWLADQIVALRNRAEKAEAALGDAAGGAAGVEEGEDDHGSPAGKRDEP
jgi:hypothetical protein